MCVYIYIYVFLEAGGTRSLAALRVRAALPRSRAPFSIIVYILYYSISLSCYIIVYLLHDYIIYKIV